MAHLLTRPESRSRVSEKLHRIMNLLIELNGDEGASMEEDASRLREVARLAASAAHDLDPREL